MQKTSKGNVLNIFPVQNSVNMYECYNTAYFYLKDKYGYRRGRLMDKATDKLRNTNKKADRLELERKFTDKDYHIILNVTKENVPDEDDKLVLLLMEQYPLGICVKKELHDVLVYLNVIKPLAN